MIVLNVILAYTLSRPDAYGVAGLAIAQSIVAGVEVLMLGVIMVARDRKLFDASFWSEMFRIVSVTGFALVAGFISVQFWPLLADDKGATLLFKLAGIAGVTLTTHVVMSAAFGVAEAKPVFAWLKRLALHPLKIEY